MSEAPLPFVHVKSAVRSVHSDPWGFMDILAIVGNKRYKKKIIFLSFFPQDDIIDDVGDFVAAAEILKERGAYKIYIMATHGLLSADAPRLIEESAIDEVSPPQQEFVISGLCSFPLFSISVI